MAILFASAGAALGLIDPRDDFGTGIFPTVVWDSRVDKLRVFPRYQAGSPVEGLILGSSRAMKLPPAALHDRTGLRFFNFAVENARAEDYLAVYRWVRSQGARPRVLLIGLDLEALHDNDVPERALARNAALQKALTGRANPWLAFWALKRDFTPSDVKDALLSVRLALWPRENKPVPYFAADGYLNDPDLESQRARGMLDRDGRIAECLPVYRRRFQDMTRLSPRRKGYLETLLAEAGADGVCTVVWLTPLHPITVRYLDERTPYQARLEEARAYLPTLARRPGVVSYDYSSPERYEGSLAGWDDCAHVDPEQATLIATRLVSGLR